MKKSLVALALFGAFAATAQAQSSVVIYGTVDAGVTKSTGTSTAIGARNNNKLGFMGTEDLGNGLKAIFQLEMRYSPDTGTLEGNGTRPLFQGQSRVGLQGAFGTVRLGRGLTSMQESILRFEPWSGIPSKAGFNNTDMQLAGYNSDPLSAIPDTTSKNRFSNAVFYNTPMIAGFQVNATVGTKEGNNNPAIVGTGTTSAPQFPANSVPSAVPYSLSATYDNGPIAVLAAYERNAVESKMYIVGASYKVIEPLKLMASYTHQDQGSTLLNNTDTKSYLVGANYTMGPGKFLAGYGQKDPDGAAKTKQASLGYEYSLSKRTYVYVDASNKKIPAVSNNATSINSYGVGVSHNF
jgi:predicted porin